MELLDEAVYVSLLVNDLGKDMNFSPSNRQIVGLSNFGIVTGIGKGNFEFKPTTDLT